MGRAWVGLVLCALAGCTSTPYEARFETREKVVRAQVRDLSAWARKGWKLPFKVRVFLSNASHGQVLPSGQAGREVALVEQQLRAVRDAYAQTPFDLYAVDIMVRPGERELRLDADALRLTVGLPVPEAEDQVVEPVPAGEVLDELASNYRWKRSGRWYEREQTQHLVAALRRDLKKLIRLEDSLELECRRLELLAASARRHANRRRALATFTPSEAGFARAAQFRATYSLYRVLNTLARWRLASADPNCSVRAEAALAVIYARNVMEAFLGWILETVVGGRTTLKFWTKGFWDRNPLYQLLDGEAKLVPLSPGQRPGRVPRGSIRALLSLRIDGDLRGWFSDLDALWRKLRPAAPPEGPLQEDLRPILARIPTARRRAKDRRGSGFTAWKELWDARIKNTFSFPLYEAIASISRFLGSTRVTHPAPRVSKIQLEDLAERLRPGDIILARSDHYLSNAFLPGFWPHAILYLGPSEGWTGLRLPSGELLADDPIVRQALALYRKPAKGGSRPGVIEAIARGVVFNSLEHSVRKDYVAVLRPLIAEAKIAAGIRRALSFLGRPYDFQFDFASDDRLVCTELVYQAYDSELNFRVAMDAPKKNAAAREVPGVLTVVGRQAMPANELARYLLYMQRHPKQRPAWKYPGRKLALVAVLDRPAGGGKGAVLLTGPAALKVFRQTVDR